MRLPDGGRFSGVISHMPVYCLGPANIQREHSKADYVCPIRVPLRRCYHSTGCVRTKLYFALN
jgi:hypothetical protein